MSPQEACFVWLAVISSQALPGSKAKQLYQEHVLAYFALSHALQSDSVLILAFVLQDCKSCNG